MIYLKFKLFIVELAELPSKVSEGFVGFCHFGNRPSIRCVDRGAYAAIFDGGNAEYGKQHPSGIVGQAGGCLGAGGGHGQPRDLHVQNIHGSREIRGPLAG